MDALDVGLLAVMAVSVVALIFAEKANSQRGMWIAKPLASAAFVILGIPIANVWFFAALVLSFLGDLCLVPKAKRIFRAGILLFLLAHIAFLGAFITSGIAWVYLALALVPLIIAAVLIGRWLMPQVPDELRIAVLAYIGVITAMVAGAAGAVAAGASPLLLLAALMFWTNDILIARDRFVTRTWINRLVGLPLYYGSMAIFALAASGSL